MGDGWVGEWLVDSWVCGWVNRGRLGGLVAR